MTQPIYVNGRFTAQNLSGVQRFAIEMTAALQRRYGDRLQLLAPAGTAGNFPAASSVGRLHGHPWEQIELPRFARDAVLVNLGNTAPLLGQRQIVVIHDAGVFSTPEAYSWKFRWWYKSMQRILAARGTTIVTVSAFSQADIARHLGIEPAAITVISEGADHIARTGVDDQILSRHGLMPGRFVLVVGNLAAHKNLPALGALAAMLAERGCELAITGAIGGAAFQSNGHGQLPQPARYLGRVSDEALKSLYQTAVCFVFPSRYEGFGLPAVEAMACGCPVVAADIACLRETCGGAALFCDPLAPDHIAAQVAQLLNSPVMQAELRAAGQQRTQALSWDRAAALLGEVIERVERRAA